jgi:hypothetical protein
MKPERVSAWRARFERSGIDVNTTIIMAKITPFSWWASRLEWLAHQENGGKSNQFHVGIDTL